MKARPANNLQDIFGLLQDWQWRKQLPNQDTDSSLFLFFYLIHHHQQQSKHMSRLIAQLIAMG